ncbi:MAG: hypothetical protein WDW38_007726 [Sanguina aurantia]
MLDREIVTAAVSNTAVTREDINPAYNLLLRSELLGVPIVGVLSPEKATQMDQLCSPATPNRRLFRYLSGDTQSPHGGQAPPSPFAVAPIGDDTCTTASQFTSPKKAARRIARAPFKVLDAPSLQDDFYLNLIDWSSQNVLAVGLGSCVYLWSAHTSQVTKLTDLASLASPDTVTSVSWSQKGTYLSVGTNSGTVQLWDVGKQSLVRTLDGHRAHVGSIAWGAQIMSSGSRDKHILQRDIRVCGLKWSPDDRQLASGGNDNQLLIWSASMSSAQLKFSDHTAAVKAIAWSPHQHGLLASGGGTADKCIRFWNTTTGCALEKIDTGSQVCNLSWSRNVNEIVSTHGYSQNQVVVWKYPTMTKLVTLTGHTMRVLFLAVSPDGQTIVTGAGDETLRFWNVFPGLKTPGSDVGMLQMPRNTIR